MALRLDSEEDISALEVLNHVLAMLILRLF